MKLLSKLLKPNVDKLREKLCPRMQFLRNFKGSHKSRLQKTITTGQLEKHVTIIDTAYDMDGNVLPKKIAVYADSQSTEALFFQFYATTKAEENTLRP